MTTFKELCDRIEFSSEFGEAESKGWENWRVYLSYQGRSMELDFFGGEMVEDIECTDVISSLILDSSACDLSFEEWCDEFGYNNDSIRDHSICEASQAIGEEFKALLGDDFELFVKAESEE